MSSKPLAVDLYCGLGGWAEGLLSEGFDVIGFDIERHDYGTGGYPGQLVIQDVLTLHGSQFKDAAVIVASPPCQEYSYMAMPWSRAKAKAAWYREDPTRQIALTALFDACFRIQQEAIDANCGACPRRRCIDCIHCSDCGSRHIPLVVENVRGARPWVGLSKANYGSFHLWGDVGMAGDRVIAGPPRFGIGLSPRGGRKNNGGSWFAIANNTTSGHGQNPDGRKLNPDGTGHPPGSWFKIADSKNRGAESGQKVTGYSDPRRNGGRGAHLTSQIENDDGLKLGGSWFHGYRKGQGPRNHGSKSSKRKAASAQIAKIPFALAQHIARCYKPHVMEANIA